jgi:hypothetical protein
MITLSAFVTLNKENPMNVLKSLQQALADHKADLALLDGVLLGQGFIVTIGGFALSFDGNKTPAITRPGRADRFDQATAERIAERVHNANGETGRAIHVRAALLEAIIFLEGSIADLSKA